MWGEAASLFSMPPCRVDITVVPHPLGGQVTPAPRVEVSLGPPSSGRLCSGFPCQGHQPSRPTAAAARTLLLSGDSEN